LLLTKAHIFFAVSVTVSAALSASSFISPLENLSWMVEIAFFPYSCAVSPAFISLALA
jgi:hypothetical protein